MYLAADLSKYGDGFEQQLHSAVKAELDALLEDNHMRNALAQWRWRDVSMRLKNPGLELVLGARVCWRRVNDFDASWK